MPTLLSKKSTWIIIGLICAISLNIFLRQHWDGPMANVAAITLLCAIWWMSEALPIPITALIPLAVFPVLGILKANEVAAAYGDSVILLMLGALMLSTVMVKTQTHRHLALHLVRMFGGHSQKRVVIGVLVSAAVLSMWISNAATALMLLPIILAITEQVNSKRFTIALLLAVAYGANIGGIGTPIGTPANLVFLQAYEGFTGQTISFLHWMQWGMLIVALLVPLVAWWLSRSLSNDSAVIIPHPGPWLSKQKRMLWVFALTALAWITRTEPFGGWVELFNLPGANDASVALLAVVALFLIPDGEGERLLDWETASRIPWNVLLLFAGGICLAKAFVVTGLSEVIGFALSDLAFLPIFLMILVVAGSVSFLTEFTSNTATTALLMPILGSVALANNMDPLMFMLPAVLAASCAFMFPVGTPPNAIVFSTNQINIRTMFAHGFIVNIMAIVVISSVVYFFL